MKVNLILEESKTLNGYENINLGKVGRSDISPEVDDASATEILAHHVLQVCPLPQIEVVLTSWFKKLRLGGKLSVAGTEVYSVSREYNYGRIGLSEFNKLMYASHNCSALNSEDIVDVLEKLGLKVTKKRLEGFYFVVEGERTV